MNIAIHNLVNFIVRRYGAAPLFVQGVMLLVVTAFAPSAFASDLSRISVFALGPVDGRAVFKYPNGKMAILNLGGSLKGTDARLVQVLNDRVVLEDMRKTNGHQPIRELVWLYKADADGHSEEKRFSLESPPQSVIEVKN